MLKSSTKTIAATLAATNLISVQAQDDHTERFEHKIQSAFTTFAKEDTLIHTSERETGRPTLHEEEPLNQRKDLH